MLTFDFECIVAKVLNLNLNLNPCGFNLIVDCMKIYFLVLHAKRWQQPQLPEELIEWTKELYNEFKVTHIVHFFCLGLLYIRNDKNVEFTGFT